MTVPGAARAQDVGSAARAQDVGSAARARDAGSAQAPPMAVTRAPAPPEPAVIAALVAAVDQLWASAPRVGSDPTASVVDHTTWRFSGRWWAKPTVLRRDRPATRR